MGAKTLRIGGASGYWGDAPWATRQLLQHGNVDVIVYDYLAEVTLSILARARVKDPETGYALDFVNDVMASNIAAIGEQGVTIVSNAGGVNPESCARALRAVIDAAGLDLNVACVVGDDVSLRAADMSAAGVTEMFSGDAFPAPESVRSVNAYLGARPIVAALDAGADIVITGRCVDSAVTLAACVHRFGWQWDDFDRLAQASLAGHLIECGVQVTGGNHTDWADCAADIDTLGYPIADVSADGSFVCSKSPGTGGVVHRGVVAEQLLYEVHDPQRYLLPDVTCDFTAVTLEEIAVDCVRVTNARGNPPGEHYKVSVTYADGWRAGTSMTFYGGDAAAKARAQAQAVFRSCRRQLAAIGLDDFDETSSDIVGADSQFGARAAALTQREVVLTLAAKHRDARALGMLLKTAVSLGLAAPPGLCGFQSSRPRPSPVIRLFSCLAHKSTFQPQVLMDGAQIAVQQTLMSDTSQQHNTTQRVQPELALLPTSSSCVPLIRLAWARSGDKGDIANIGVIAREPEYAPFIWASLSEARLQRYFAHWLARDAKAIERFWLPGIAAMNVVLHDVLGGGGMASIRTDAQGKGFSQLLLEMPVRIPDTIAQRLAPVKAINP
ncbi:MAG: acyclic terpene utilization AtuA family protein [Pseudomonadota bacterium]